MDILLRGTNFTRYLNELQRETVSIFTMFGQFRDRKFFTKILILFLHSLMQSIPTRQRRALNQPKMHHFLEIFLKIAKSGKINYCSLCGINPSLNAVLSAHVPQMRKRMDFNYFFLLPKSQLYTMLNI